MIDPYILLQNRSDLGKLEEDLEALLEFSNSHELDEELRLQIQTARQDLEMARAAHIDLCFRLTGHDPVSRAAARNELNHRIQAGELKIYDPRVNLWRQASDLLIDANLQEEEAERQEMDRRQLEEALASALEKNPRLIDLQRLLRKADELDRRQMLSVQGHELLGKAQAFFDESLNQHRDLTLKVRDGSLKEKYYALDQIHILVTNGETQILDGPSHTWRPAMEVLAEAEEQYNRASENAVAKVLKLVEEQYKVNPERAINAFYQALDQSIPYREEDRATLELRYLELYRLFERRANPPSKEEEALQGIQIKVAQRYKNWINQSGPWLYQFYDASLTHPVSKLLMEAAKPETPPNKVLDLVEMAISLAQKALENSIEIPEVMVRGAILCYNLGLFDKARSLLDQAVPLYALEKPLKIHRHAVTSWLLGLADYSMGNRLHAYSEWKSARSLFTDLMTQALLLKKTNMAGWYQARLHDIDLLSMQTFEVVYNQWLPVFEPLAMSEGLREIRRIMDGQFSRQQYPELRKSIERMLKDSQQELTADMHRVALVEAAFFEYELNDFEAAADHLSDAWIRFQHNHYGAVILWLLGLVRWWIPSQRTQALLNWEESIRLFQDLARQADKENEQSRRVWYETQLELMPTCLKQWVELTQ